MVNLILSLLSLVITVFIFILIIDVTLFAYKMFKRLMKQLFNKHKTVENETTDVLDLKLGKCNKPISDGCRKCAYVNECFQELGLFPEVKEVQKHEKGKHK